MKRKIALLVIAVVFVLSLAVPALMVVGGSPISLEGGAKGLTNGQHFVSNDPPCPPNTGGDGTGCG